MDKIVFASEAGLQNNLNYAVGIFQDGELHITPLKNLFHMKVRCDYLDESDKRAKEGMKNLEEG
jgi:DNA-directed RNA polymerase-3 subunit RPC5